MEIIAVVIADDHPLVRKAVKNTFRNKSDIQFLGEADNGIELLGLMEKKVPDVAIVDLHMPGMDGYDAIYELHSLYPEIKIIAFSGFLNTANQKRAIEMGACASISKTETSGDFIKALEAVIQGENYHTDVSSSYYAAPPEEKKDGVLTLREKQVLSLIVQGKTSKQIGEAYNISQWTVDKHRSNIRTKLGHKSLAETIRYAIERGYTEIKKE